MTNSDLIAAGWRVARTHENGECRWTHPDMPSVGNRRRLFSTEQATTLLAASVLVGEGVDAIAADTGD